MSKRSHRLNCFLRQFLSSPAVLVLSRPLWRRVWPMDSDAPYARRSPFPPLHTLALVRDANSQATAGHGDSRTSCLRRPGPPGLVQIMQMQSNCLHLRESTQACTARRKDAELSELCQCRPRTTRPAERRAACKIQNRPTPCSVLNSIRSDAYGAWLFNVFIMFQAVLHCVLSSP